MFVLRQNGIDDGIGNLVGYLVRVAFRDGFGSKKVIFAHVKLLFASPILFGVTDSGDRSWTL
jgi:hypothetical protein